MAKSNPKEFDMSKIPSKLKQKFFNSDLLKIIAFAMLLIFALLIVITICVINNHHDFANQIWIFTERLIWAVFGAMFSAVGIKLKS